jgi:hypothetical protein
MARRRHFLILPFWQRTVSLPSQKLGFTNFQLPDRFLGLLLGLKETNILMETMGSLFHNSIIGNDLQQQPFRALLPEVPGEGVSGGSGTIGPNTNQHKGLR